MKPTVCACLPFDAYPWMVLFFLCWITFGSYWVFDMPGAIQTQFTAWFGGISVYTPDMNLTLYSIYSYPNVILALFGGYIIDKLLGVRVGTLLFCSLVLLGNVIFSFGIQYEIYWLCVVGRFVFGLGGESLTVGQNYYTQRWFEGKNLALAFGIVLAFARIGSSVNFAVTPTFATMGVPFSVWFGTMMCYISFVSCLFLAYVDWYGEARINTNTKSEDISLLYIRMFPLQAWLIFLICVFFYVSVLTFYTVASAILQNTGSKWDPVSATFFLFIPNFVAIPCCPFFGFLIDRLGRSLMWLLIASLMQVAGHVVFLGLCLEWFVIHPSIIMVWIGIAYSMFAASIWPLLPFVIKESMLGTGYGTMTAIQNAGLAAFPQIIGGIQSSLLGSVLMYIIPIFIFIGCAGISFVLTVILWIVDKSKTGGVLNSKGDIKQEHKRSINNE